MPYFSTGRGGAGNIAKGRSTPEPQEGEPGDDYPKITQEVYTTGRGGAGNMRQNTDEEKTRMAQDVDQDDRIIEPSRSNPSFGRGGYGNVQAAREAEKQTLLQRAMQLFRGHN
jgi:hypothetical protein